jgi:class 3 adenylate cyclase
VAHESECVVYWQQACGWGLAFDGLRRGASRSGDCTSKRRVSSRRRRAAEGLPITNLYLGLHVGEVFYGNIGSEDRLDFTVIGPAVKEVSRIVAMCRSIDQLVLLSSAFALAAGDAPNPFVSVGRCSRSISPPVRGQETDRGPYRGTPRRGV